MMRCHDDETSSITEVAAQSAAATDAACTCVNVDVLSGTGRRFSSPVRTAFHGTGCHEADDAVPGQCFKLYECTYLHVLLKGCYCSS